jgi:hypothetical protein
MKTERNSRKLPANESQTIKEVPRELTLSAESTEFTLGLRESCVAKLPRRIPLMIDEMGEMQTLLVPFGDAVGRVLIRGFPSRASVTETKKDGLSCWFTVLGLF